MPFIPQLLSRAILLRFPSSLFVATLPEYLPVRHDISFSSIIHLTAHELLGWTCGALLQKCGLRRDFPVPLLVQATLTISAVPSALKRLMRAMRMWISAVSRLNHIIFMSTEFSLDLRTARRKAGFVQEDIAQLLGSHQSAENVLTKGIEQTRKRGICVAIGGNGLLMRRFGC